MVMILPRLPIWWELATAALRCGIVICPATTLLVDGDIRYRCQRSQASVFVGDRVSIEKFLRVGNECPDIKHILQIDGDEIASNSSSIKITNLATALSAVPENAQWTQNPPAPTDPALIYFTSGTTGPPKMVLHTQISYPLAHVLTGKHWLRFRPDETALYWNLSEQGWAKAAWSFFSAWTCGAGLFVYDDRGAFDGRKVVEMLNAFPVTTLCAPPTVYRQLVLEEMRSLFHSKRPKALRHCTGAGEPLNAEVIRLWKAMNGLDICDGYGQTETILVCGNFEDKEIRPGSMGRATPGVPLHTVDAEGKECKVGEEGDIAIVVGGGDGFYGIFEGYLKEDGALDRRLFHAKDGRKWYRTGDRATRDRDGYFWFVGRSDDVINSAGYRIGEFGPSLFWTRQCFCASRVCTDIYQGPFEVESTLKQHPAVIESAVVASPDKDRGEVVKAFVVLTSQYTSKDATKLIKELQDFCKDKAAPYKYPRKIQFVEPEFLPKTISGKIKRNELKKMEWAGDGGPGGAKL